MSHAIARISALIILVGFTAIARADGPATLPPGTVRMIRTTIKDDTGTGLDAYTLLVPADWKALGKITWDTDRTVAPVNVLVHASDADNSEGYSSLPAILCVWSPTMQQYSAQMGGKSQGCPIVKPPSGPIDAIKKFIIPVYMKQIAANYKEISSEELPKVAAAYAPTYNKPGQPAGTIRAAKMRVQYQSDGISKEGEIVCVFLYNKGQGGVVWGLDHITLVYAPQGSLDKEIGKLDLIAGSLQETQKFTRAVDQVTQMLIQKFYTDETAIMQRAAAEAQAQQQMSQEQMADWQSNENARFNAVENYDAGAIRGVVNCYDPNSGNIVQVPDDFTHAWSDSSGEVIYTDDENFNPSHYENGNWTELQPVKQP
jgi:hypothetical protein